jgi:hypothetical protein
MIKEAKGAEDRVKQEISATSILRAAGGNKATVTQNQNVSRHGVPYSSRVTATQTVKTQIQDAATAGAFSTAAPP